MTPELNILMCDDDIILCEKPAGVLSQPGETKELSMIEFLRETLSGEVYPVHRLDRQTRGLMVYARNAASAASLSRQIQNGIMKKQYLAVVHGEVFPASAVLEDLLLHDRRKNKSYVVDRQRKGVKKAVLDYQVLAVRDEKSLLQIRLHTGRTHQIRVQFSSRQHPLVGDQRYGGGKGELSLVSTVLSFQHPRTGKTLSFTFVPDSLDIFSEIQLKSFQ